VLGFFCRNANRSLIKNAELVNNSSKKRVGVEFVRGIYFINDQIQLNDLSKEESVQLQEESLLDYIHEHKIQIVKLNPYQLNDHYTLLHALLYDLKKVNAPLDCFIYYSEKVLNDFILTYPARWLMIKSYFDTMVPVISYDSSHKSIV